MARGRTGGLGRQGTSPRGSVLRAPTVQAVTRQPATPQAPPGQPAAQSATVDPMIARLTAQAQFTLRGRAPSVHCHFEVGGPGGVEEEGRRYGERW